jgi:hypothetical protein
VYQSVLSHTTPYSGQPLLVCQQQKCHHRSESAYRTTLYGWGVTRPFECRNKQDVSLWKQTTKLQRRMLWTTVFCFLCFISRFASMLPAVHSLNVWSNVSSYNTTRQHAAPYDSFSSSGIANIRGSNLAAVTCTTVQVSKTAVTD